MKESIPRNGVAVRVVAPCPTPGDEMIAWAESGEGMKEDASGCGLDRQTSRMIEKGVEALTGDTDMQIMVANGNGVGAGVSTHLLRNVHATVHLHDRLRIMHPAHPMVQVNLTMLKSEPLVWLQCLLVLRVLLLNGNIG